jgi:hypothetical protein
MGADALLPKPFSATDLTYLIEAMLSEACAVA